MPLHKALLALWLAAGSGAKRAENVVMLLADDLGWADVSVPPHTHAALRLRRTQAYELPPTSAAGVASTADLGQVLARALRRRRPASSSC